ncbi:centrosomal protein 43-like isoform X1 [Megalops cyprinoides]|uniref:centrosomal protein 43-like isoform X1 n=1 Tax=Megalops cyprinoides TaxID=118141 RepID=UPI0018653FE1|nr:centrosomal protein 43-like isoform X1 [Megalops cyprinoides]
MSAAEEDTELRDLLIQNLENSGVLNKIKAELRAAVFLALEEQEKVENKTPLVNESLKKCLNTKDGRLVASLITDFLQVFNLDFTLAVFQPEINTLNGLENREVVARELGIPDPEGNKSTPLLLELIKRGRHKTTGFEEDRVTQIPKELSPKKIADARRRFDFYDKDKKGAINKDAVRALFADLFPNFNQNMLERYVTDEFAALDKDFSNGIDFQEFVGMHRRFFIQCKSVVSDTWNRAHVLACLCCLPVMTHLYLSSNKVTNDVSDIAQTPSKFIEEKTCTSSASKVTEVTHSDTSVASGSTKAKGHVPVTSRSAKLGDGSKRETPLPKKGSAGLEVDEKEDEGDSFFDDPLPAPQKTYGSSLSVADKNKSGESLSEKIGNHRELSRTQREKCVSGGPFQMRKESSLNDLSAINSDTEEDAEGSFADRRRRDLGKAVGGPTSLSDTPLPKTDLGSVGPSLEDPSENINRDKDDDYDDDFNSTSHRSKSEVSIGEEIEEVSIEEPDTSDKV